jgi:hypothetical protein
MLLLVSSILGLLAVFATKATPENVTVQVIRYVKKSTSSSLITQKALCVVGCTPSVNPKDPTCGILIWDTLVWQKLHIAALSWFMLTTQRPVLLIATIIS